MEENYKPKFYAKYVSTHNARLFGKLTADAASGFFPVFSGHYARFLPADKKARILDLGCGNGALIYWLQSIGFSEAAGVDVSPEQAEIAKSLGAKNIYCESLVDFLEKSKTEYDLIFIRDTLGHFNKKEIFNIMELMYGNTKKGGKLIIKTPNAESPLSGQLRYGDFTHEVGFTRTSLQQLAEVVGFERTEAYSTPPVVHGLKSGVRFLLWKFIELCIRFYRLVDAGNGEGIYTQNVIVAAYK